MENAEQTIEDEKEPIEVVTASIDANSMYDELNTRMAAKEAAAELIESEMKLVNINFSVNLHNIIVIILMRLT